MPISLILAHPDPASLNHAIAHAARRALEANGHTVWFHDLYAEGFDPILPAAEAARGAALPRDLGRHCDEIATAEGLILVHPNWWGQPPAILKGWVDRVLRVDVAYRFEEGDGGEGVPVGLLRAKAALVFNTSNTPLRRELDAFGDPLEREWRDCILGLCGVCCFERRMFNVVVTSSPAERAAWLAEVQAAVWRLFPPTGYSETTRGL